jgi:hypothetical protein
MNTIAKTGACFSIALGLLAACGASQNATLPPEQPVQGTTSTDGVTAQQAVADEEVVERISAARCDRDQSCDRVGPGAVYHDRADCMRQQRLVVRKDLNPESCPGGIGEVALTRCVKSVEAGTCDRPGEITGNVSHCKLAALCIKR